MQRRHFIGLGLATALALSAGIASLTGLPAGLSDGRLTAAGRTVFTSIARATLAGALPRFPGEQRVALDSMLEGIDRLLEQMPPALQDELSQLIGLVGTAPGRRLLVGLEQDWSVATADEVHGAMKGMCISRLQLRQQAYQGLRDIVTATYFAQEATWAFVGYPGPQAI